MAAFAVRCFAALCGVPSKPMPSRSVAFALSFGSIVQHSIDGFKQKEHAGLMIEADRQLESKIAEFATNFDENENMSVKDLHAAHVSHPRVRAT